MLVPHFQFVQNSSFITAAHLFILKYKYKYIFWFKLYMKGPLKVSHAVYDRVMHGMWYFESPVSSYNNWHVWHDISIEM